MNIAIDITSPVNVEKRRKLGIRSGDTVRVWQKIEEKGKTRLQAFEGLVLARKHGNEAGGTFTVRRLSGSVGIEKIFPLYSPMIDSIEIIKRSKVRRAKLYYIRDKVAREIRRQMRNTTLMNLKTGSDIAEKQEEERAKAEKEKSEEEIQETDIKKTEEEIVEEKENTEPEILKESTPQEDKKA